MAARFLSYKGIIAIGAILFGFMFFVSWGLERSLSPNEAQRVRASAGATPFNGGRAYETLKEILAFGPREPGSEASAKTRALLKRNLRQIGLTVKEDTWEADTPLGPKTMTNLWAIVEGSKPGVVILGNHYDTKYMPDINFISANDGGSTTAWMLEMARALGPKRAGASVWLVWFDGEEAYREWSETDSLYGSRRFVAQLREQGQLDDIRSMVNVDMIGDCYLGISKDAHAPKWMVDAVWREARALGYNAHFSPLPHDVEDDHIPFREAGIPAMVLIDFRYGGSPVDHNRNWHTANDTIDLVCKESLQAVGDVMYQALPFLEVRP